MNKVSELRRRLQRCGLLSADEAAAVTISLAISEVNRTTAMLSRRYTVSKAGAPFLSVKFLPRTWKFRAADIVATYASYAKLEAFKVPRLLAHFSTRQGDFFVEEHLPPAKALAQLVDSGEVSGAQAKDIVKQILVSIWDAGTTPSRQFVEREKVRYREWLETYVHPGVLGDALWVYIENTIDSSRGELRRVLSSGDIIDRNILFVGGAWYLTDFEYAHPTLFFYKEAYRSIMYSRWASDLSVRDLCPFLGPIPEDTARLLAVAWETHLYAHLLDTRAVANSRAEFRERFWNILDPELTRRLDQEVEAGRATLRARDDELHNAQGVLQANQQHIESLHGELTTHQTELASLRTELDSVHARLAAREADVAGMRAELDVGVAQLQTRDADVESLRAQLGQHEAEKAGLRAAADALQQELVARQAEVAGMEAELDSRAARIDARSAEIDRLRALLHDHKATIGSLLADINSRNLEFDALQQEHAARVAEIARLDLELNARTADLQAREADLDRMRLQLEAQADGIAQLQSHLIARAADLQQSAAAMDNLGAQLDARFAEIANLHAVVGSRDVEIARLRHQRSDNQAEITNLLTEREVLAQQIEALRRQSQADQAHRTGLERHIVERDQTVQSQEIAIGELRHALEARQREIEHIQRSTWWRIRSFTQRRVQSCIRYAHAFGAAVTRVPKYVLRRLTSAAHGPARLLRTCGRLVLQAVTAVALIPVSIMFRLLLPVRWRSLVAAAPLEPPLKAFDRRLATIIILNWNGEDLLRECLPSVVHAVQKSGEPHEILVVDNGSTDASVEFVEREYADRVGVLKLDRNYGFGEGNNRGVRAARHDYIVLLNNDMIVDEEFLGPLMSRFVDDGVFAVASEIRLADPQKPREETGNTRGWFHRGQVSFSHEPIQDSVDAPPEQPVLWAGGGSSAFDKKKFLDLDGFDALFSPAYVEDTDVCYRAWKRGWRCLFAPESIVYHKHRASSSRRFSRRQLDALLLRNQWLFHLKNLTDKRLYREFLLWLPYNAALQAQALGALTTLATVLRVCLRMPSLWVRRRREIHAQKVSDLDVLSLNRRVMLPASRRGDRTRILFVTAFLPMEGVHAGGQRVFKLMRGLARTHSVSLLSFYDRDEELVAVPALQTFCADVITLKRQRSVDAFNPLGIRPGSIIYEYMNPEMRRAIAVAAHSGLYDAIQFEWLQMAALAPRFTTVKKILTHHEVQFAAKARLLASGARRTPRMRLAPTAMLDYEFRLMQPMNLIITMTDADAEQLLAYRSRLPVIVHNTGVDRTQLRPAARQSDSKIVTFVGYFRHAPNVDAVLYFCKDVWPLIREAEPEARFRIVGSQPPEEVSRLARDPSIEVAGWVDSLLPYLHETHVFVVPMRQGAGIRGKILEAWACQLPVVSTPLGSAGLRAVSGRHLLLADAPDTFAEAVIRLLRDRELCRLLGKQGYEQVMRYYDWEAKIREHVSIYDHLLGCGTSVRVQNWVTASDANLNAIGRAA